MEMEPADPAELGLDPQRLARVGTFFQRYVDDGRLPGFSVQVARHGRIAYRADHGQRDLEAAQPIEPDTLFRIYSMTKPITSIAAMMFYERGAFDLNDPVSRYIPAFAEPRVYAGGSAAATATVAATEPIRIRHLLTHTSGLTYGFHRVHPVDELYRTAGFEFAGQPGQDLADVVDRWAQLPLVFQPGTSWLYSVATDVLGRLVEVVSGMKLDDVLRTEIFEPLGMTDTGFAVTPEQAGRLAALYAPHPATGKAVRYDTLGRTVLDGGYFLSGGGGLVSTVADYHRFTEFLRRGGELGGARLIGPRTLGFMTRNHLPGGQDLGRFGIPLFAETLYDGVGFGLGFSVLDDPVANGVLGSAGEFGWGGLASTVFWVAPAEDLTVIFMTQLAPSSTYPVRSQLRQLIYSSIID